MNKIRLSIIIVAYKSKKIISNCLESIYKNNDAEDQIEIIVVDNSPDMELYNFLVSNYKNIRIIKNHNNGFGAGNNIGVRNSHGEYLLFLNPDTELIEPVFKFAIKKFDDNDKLGMFGVSLLNKYHEKTYSYFFIDKYSIIAAFFQKYLNKKNIFIPHKMHIHGADIFIRRKIFEKAGMFDENIFMYEEEADLTKRIYKIFPDCEFKYFPEKRILHLEGGSSPGIIGQYNSIERLMKTEIYYCKKYNINFEKRLKKRIRYQILKLIYFRFISLDAYKEQKNIYKLYMSYRYDKKHDK